MAIRLAINGFGRTGRAAFRVAFEKPEIDVVAINDLAEPATITQLLRYDTIYGPYRYPVEAGKDSIVVNHKRIATFAEKDPTKLPWGNLQVDVVIESTGAFTDPKKAQAHISAGAKRVVISAPSKGDQPTTSYIIGLNEDELGDEAVIDSSSCTTNCIALVVAILHQRFGVLKAAMTTAHAYTADQNLHDGPHRDLRRARAAGLNIVPSTTGASENTTKIIKELAGKFSGIALRVPVACGSISDITALVSKQTTVEQVTSVFEEAAKQPRYRGILAVTHDPIVSSDVIGRPESAIVDLPLTQVTDGDLVKVFAWYDNELGYSTRLVEQVILVGKLLRLI